MPKAPRVSRKAAHRQNPLENDILETGILRNKTTKKRTRADDEEGNHFVDAKASRTILRIGRELLEEDEVAAESHAPAQPKPGPGAFDYASRPDLVAADEAQQYGDAEDDDDDAEEWGDEEDDIEEIEVDPDDLETYKRFLPEEEDELLMHGWDRKPAGGEAAPAAEGEGTNLADLILQKIAEFEATQDGGKAPMPVDEEPELSPKIVAVYTQVGEILSRWRSGKLPKPFKILPQIPRWEEIIQICKPWDWTPNACYAATRLWVGAKPLVVQRFLEHVILDKVRDDIQENKKLNVHLFNCLRRSLFKPSAFFKGFLFPLVASGTCTLREAHIVAGVLTRVSIPVLHSAAAIKGLCDIAAEQASQGTEGGGATNVLIRALLAKRLALPYQVIDALVFHFLRFRSVDPISVKESADLMTVGTDGTFTKGRLPVIWHQCLLEFAQRYKNDITEDQREALLDLLLTHGHSAIAADVRRELLAGRGRGVPIMQAEAESVWDGDDTMQMD